MIRRTTPVVIAVVITILAFAWAWRTPTYLESDAAEYARLALEYRGVDHDAATWEAASTRCATMAQYGLPDAYVAPARTYVSLHPDQAGRADDPRFAAIARTWGVDPVRLGACTVYLIDHPTSHDPRYAQIFDSRPLLPALVAIAHTWLDLPSSLKLINGLSVAIAGLLVALTVRVARFSWPWALSAQALVYLTPFFTWGVRPFTEGLAGLGLAAFLLGVALTTVGRYRSGLVVAGLAIAVMVGARSHVALIAGGAALVSLLATTEGRQALRRWHVITPVAAAIIVGLGVPAALGWPGLTTSLQDLVTRHFHHRDSTHLWGAYRRVLQESFTTAYRQPLMIASTAAFTALIATAVALVRKPALTVAILVPVVVGVASVIAHPMINTSSRLLSPAWLGVSVALVVTVAASANELRHHHRLTGEAVGAELVAA